MKSDQIRHLLQDDQTMAINNANRRGPFVLEERHIAESLAYYSKNCLPESPNGLTASGVFKVTGSMKSYTNLPFLQEEGTETAVIAHFSTTVHGEQEATEAVREPHDFSVKFCTDEGNYHFVGSNVPVSFVSDPIVASKLQDQLSIQDSVSYWEFIANAPETTNMLIHLFTNEGLPASYRTMSGTTLHPYIWINSEGKEYVVKLHWIPKQGIVSMNAEQAERAETLDRLYATHDTYMAIERGDYPKWDLYVQMLDPGCLNKYEYDPLNLTNEWLERDIPYHKIGTMILNENRSDGEDTEKVIRNHDVSLQWLVGSHTNGKENNQEYKQAGDIYRSYREDVQKALVKNLVNELDAVKSVRPDLPGKVIAHLYLADEGLGKAVADGCGIALAECFH